MTFQASGSTGLEFAAGVFGCTPKGAFSEFHEGLKEVCGPSVASKSYVNDNRTPRLLLKLEKAIRHGSLEAMAIVL